MPTGGRSTKTWSHMGTSGGLSATLIVGKRRSCMNDEVNEPSSYRRGNGSCSSPLRVDFIAV
jgi:hypothetical protein